MSRPAETSDEILWSYGFHRPLSPLVKSAIGAAIAAFFTMVTSVFLCFQLWHLPPPAPMWPAGIAAIVGAVLIHYIRLPARLWQIDWNGQHITVIDSHRQRHVINPDSVALVSGESGLSFHGGEMIQWKRVHIITHDRRFSISLSGGSAERCFNRLTKICLNAVCISAWGKVQLGSPMLNDIPGWLTQAEKAVRKEFRRQSLRALLGTVICATVALATGALAFAGFSQKGHEGDAGKAVVLAVVSAASGVLLFSAMLRRLRRGRIVSRALHIAISGKSIDPIVFDEPA